MNTMTSRQIWNASMCGACGGAVALLVSYAYGLNLLLWPLLGAVSGFCLYKPWEICINARTAVTAIRGSVKPKDPDERMSEFIHVWIIAWGLLGSVFFGGASAVLIGQPDQMMYCALMGVVAIFVSILLGGGVCMFCNVIIHNGKALWKLPLERLVFRTWAYRLWRCETFFFLSKVRYKVVEPTGQEHLVMNAPYSAFRLLGLTAEVFVAPVLFVLFSCIALPLLIADIVITTILWSATAPRLCSMLCGTIGAAAGTVAFALGITQLPVVALLGFAIGLATGPVAAKVRSALDFEFTSFEDTSLDTA